MLTKSETRKLEAKERDWGEAMRPVDRFWKELKKIIKEEIEKIMYCKKSKDKIDRFAEGLVWWFKIILIFFAFKGITYWLTGR